MKKFLYLMLFFYCALYGDALRAQNNETQEEKKESPVKIIKDPHDESCMALQEPVSLSFMTKKCLYLVQNERPEKEYRISRYGGSQPIGITPEEVILDYHKKQKNPLYNDTIDFIAPSYNNSDLYAIGHKNPATLYLFTSTQDPKQIAMLSAHNIRDAQGKTTAGIVHLKEGVVFEEKMKTTYTFLAVKKNEGHFGESGSGIAALRYDPDIKEKKEKEKEKKEKEKKTEEQSRPFFDILNVKEGISRANIAYPFDLMATSLSINGGLEKIDYDVIDMYWDETFQCLYVAVRAKTKDDAQENQGACALLIGRINNKKLSFTSIIPHEALHQDSIIGTTGPGKYVSLRKVCTMTLNNALHYLVVVGGNGTPEETNQKVHAFPLINFRLHSLCGTIAKKGCQPIINTYKNNVIQARLLMEPVVTQDDFYTSNDMCVSVGGSAQLPGPISGIITRGDCVIVEIKEDGNGKAAGVFYSQAIFNEVGIVVAWTAWQRVSGGDKKTLQVIPRKNEFRFLYTEEPEDFLHMQTTKWYVPQKSAQVETIVPPNNIQEYVATQFPAGLTGITDYSVNAPGISGTNTLSVLSLLGIQKVTLLQTSECNEHGNVHPFKRAYNNILETNNGSCAGISKRDDIRGLSISGGALEVCGALTCSAIGVRNNQAWFIVGGSGGVAILADKQGAGWNARLGLGNGFKALQDDYTFKILGNYKFVRKIVCCNGYMYILTNSSLDRIMLSKSQFKNTKSLKVEHLIENFSNNGKKIFLNDIIISPQLLLLATSDGLYSSPTDNSLALKKVDLPYGSQPVTNFFVVSRTGHENDFADVGQVYIVARSGNYKETFVYRLLVDARNGYQNAIRLLQDCYKKDELSYWIHATAQQGFVTDGISLYVYCSRIKNQQAHVSLIESSEFRNRNVLKKMYLGELPLLFTKDDTIIRAMIRNSATGNWLVAGDFGLRVNM